MLCHHDKKYVLYQLDFLRPMQAYVMLKRSKAGAKRDHVLASTNKTYPLKSFRIL